jgi:short-subunit dehydrogenase
LGLAESLALEVGEYETIRVLTIFLGEVATKMWQEYDFRYYQKIRAKCFSRKMWQQKLLK